MVALSGLAFRGWGVMNFSNRGKRSASGPKGKRREGALWASQGHVGNGLPLSTCPGLSIGTRVPQMAADDRLPKAKNAGQPTSLRWFL